MAKNLTNARMGSRIRRDWYREKWVLDAGCGHGRYLQALQPGSNFRQFNIHAQYAMYIAFGCIHDSLDLG